MRFGVDKKKIREWIRSIDEVTGRAPTKKRLYGGGRKPVIMEIEEKLLKWINERIEGNAGPAIQESK